MPGKITIYEFIETVRLMRYWQKKYLYIRNSTYLANAKKYQDKVDNYLKNNKPAQQPGLFEQKKA